MTNKTNNTYTGYTMDTTTLLPTNATPVNLERFPFQHDFVLNNKPQRFLRTERGSIQIKEGAIVKTKWGLGKLINQNKIAITEYIDETAKADVARAVEAYNKMIMIECAYWERFNQTNEDTGISPSPRVRKDIDELIDMKLNSLLNENEVLMGATCSSMIKGEALYSEVKIENTKNSIKDRENRKRLAKIAKKLARLQDDEEIDFIPDFIKEEVGLIEHGEG